MLIAAEHGESDKLLQDEVSLLPMLITQRCNGEAVLQHQCLSNVCYG